MPDRYRISSSDPLAPFHERLDDLWNHARETPTLSILNAADDAICQSILNDTPERRVKYARAALQRYVRYCRRVKPEDETPEAHALDTINTIFMLLLDQSLPFTEDDLCEMLDLHNKRSREPDRMIVAACIDFTEAHGRSEAIAKRMARHVRVASRWREYCGYDTYTFVTDMAGEPPPPKPRRKSAPKDGLDVCLRLKNEARAQPIVFDPEVVTDAALAEIRSLWSSMLQEPQQRKGLSLRQLQQEVFKPHVDQGAAFLLPLHEDVTAYIRVTDGDLTEREKNATSESKASRFVVTNGRLSFITAAVLEFTPAEMKDMWGPADYRVDVPVTSGEYQMIASADGAKRCVVQLLPMPASR